MNAPRSGCPINLTLEVLHLEAPNQLVIFHCVNYKL